VSKDAIRSRSESNSSVRILLADTDRRPYAARLAMGFAALGCEVSIVCTDHHPVESLRAPHRSFSYSALGPLNSLLRAIKSTAPELIIPCDDRVVQHLHQLYWQFRTQGGPKDGVASLIERSLGPPSSYPIMSARYPLLQLAKAEGIRVPSTCLLQTPEDLSRWQSKHSFPWVLKADGTWGGGGVRVAKTPQDAEGMFRILKSPCGVMPALKRALVNRDSFYLRDWWQARGPAVIAQDFIPGRPANCAVACWEGEVLAQMSVEVLATSKPAGPANVVRRVNNAEMVKAAERIASKLHLSGFFGLDFVIERGSGQTYLLEMNPRCTPLCHIQLGGPDMIAALHARVAGRPFAAIPAEAARSEHQVIAYFPQPGNSNSEFLKLSLQDFPHSEPELAQALTRPFPQGTLLYRTWTKIRHHSPSLQSARKSFVD
jgi:hypothetical protein